MPAYKDKTKGTWYTSFYYENWTGQKEKKMKRGFKTKREALEWEASFKQQRNGNMDMYFEEFLKIYMTDMKDRIKENTWLTKEHILYNKLLPYFKNSKMCDISTKQILAWQNEMLSYRDKNGQAYSPVYLKTMHNQELICRGWFLPPNTYDCGSFVVNGTAVIGKESKHLNNS